MLQPSFVGLTASLLVSYITNMLRWIVIPVFLIELATAAQQIPVVSATKMNTLYRGIDNPIAVAVPEWKCDSLIVSSPHSLIEGSGCSYSIVPGKGTQCFVTIAGIANGDTVELGQTAFRVKDLPAPTPYFAGKSPRDKTIKKIELMAAQGVIAQMEGFDFDLKFTVSSFSVITTDSDGLETSLTSKSNRLTDEMKSNFRLLSTGSRVRVQDIVVQGPQKIAWTLETLDFEVK